MRLAVGGGCRQSRIETTEGAGQIATFFPPTRTDTGHRKIGNSDVASFDINEQRRGQHAGAHGPQQAGLANAAWADNQDLDAALLGEPLVRRDNLHGALSFVRSAIATMSVASSSVVMTSN